jgi:hypothetical protein
MAERPSLTRRSIEFVGLPKEFDPQTQRDTSST